MPAVQAWIEAARCADISPVERFAIDLAFQSGVISVLDATDECKQVQQAVARWMEGCGYFRPAWKWIVEDYAITTLLVHARGRGEARKWYCRAVPHEELNPPPTPPSPQRGGESYFDYRDRLLAEQGADKKESLELVRQRTGMRIDEETERRDARLTVLHVCCGKSYEAIMNEETDQSIFAEAISKAVRAFCKRAAIE